MSGAVPTTGTASKLGLGGTSLGLTAPIGGIDVPEAPELTALPAELGAEADAGPVAVGSRVERGDSSQTVRADNAASASLEKCLIDSAASNAANVSAPSGSAGRRWAKGQPRSVYGAVEERLWAMRRMQHRTKNGERNIHG